MSLGGLVLLYVGSSLLGVTFAGDDCDVSTGGALLQSRTTFSSEYFRQMMPTSKNPEVVNLVAKSADALSSAVTPEVKATIDKLIKIIEDSIELKLKHDHNSSQQEVTDKVKAIKDAADSVVDFHTKAKDADGAWMECVAGEKKLAEDAEAAGASSDATKEDKDKKCGESDAANTWSATVPENLATLTCDLSQGNCATEYAEYKRKLQEWADGLQTTIDVKKTEYENSKASCDEATRTDVAATGSNTQAVTAWENERVHCEGLHTDREVAICVFGEKLQDKCAAKADYDKLVAAIDANAGVESEAERENEWASMMLLKCMLKKHKNDAEFDEANMASCQADNSYVAEVGTLDKKAEEVAALMTTFTCQEATVTFFNGKTCTKPTGSLPTSAGYSCETAFTPSFTSDAASPSFAFCESTQPQPQPENPPAEPALE
jgi:hypothetical protein